MQREDSDFKTVKIPKKDKNKARLYSAVSLAPTSAMLGSPIGKAVGAVLGSRDVLGGRKPFRRYIGGELTQSQLEKIREISRKAGNKGMLAAGAAGLLLGGAFPSMYVPEYVKNEYLSSPTTAALSGAGMGAGWVGGRELAKRIVPALMKSRRLSFGPSVVHAALPVLLGTMGGTTGGEIGSLAGHAIENWRDKEPRTEEDNENNDSMAA